MKKNYTLLISCLFALFSVMQIQAQTTELFENETAGATSFTEGGFTFSSGTANFDVENFGSAGASGSDQFIDNVDNQGTGNSYTLTLTGGATAFTMQSMDVYLSSLAGGTFPTADGTLTITGRTGTTAVFSTTLNSGNTTFPIVFAPDNGFFNVNFGALPGAGDVTDTNIDNIVVTLGSAFTYIAIDEFEFDNASAEADPPEVNSITLIGNPVSTATSVSFTVTFNENAVNVNAADFAVDLTGTTGAITSVSGSNAIYTVTVSGISGEGTVSIDLIAANDIADTLGNTPAPPFTAGENFNASRCFIEDFESFAPGTVSFTSNGVGFTTSTSNFAIENFPGGGANGSDDLLSNTIDQGTGKVYTISTSGPASFVVNSLQVYVSSQADGAMPTNDGSITLEGRVAGSTIYTITKNSGFPTTFGATNGFTVIDFATDGAADYSTTNVEELRITSGGAFIYIGVDDFEHCPEVLTTDPPLVQNITLVGNPPASSAAVDYNVVFNENANNVTSNDFNLTLTGSAAGTITGISGSGNSYTVNVTGVSGEGTLRLNLLGGTDIADDDNNSPPPPFTTGEVFIVSLCNVETFESIAIDANTWTTIGVPFMSTAAFNVEEFVGAGEGNSDRYLDNISDQGTAKTYSIEVTDASTFTMNRLGIYLSSLADGTMPTNDGTLTIIGNLAGAAQYTINKATGFPTSLSTNNGFYVVDFATEGGTDNSATEIDEIVITTGGAFTYVGVDNFQFCTDPPPTAVCQNITRQLDATGNLTITPADIDNGSSDNSGTLILVSVTPNTFTCDDLGPNTVTLTVEDDLGQQSTCTATVTVEEFPLVVTFTAPIDLCIDEGVQAGLGGGTPTGGVYSGPGVTDDGDGMAYSFDPAAAGAGVHTITYQITYGTSCSESASDDVEVFALPVVAFTAPADLCIDAGVQTAQGGGTPTGGIYSGPGVTDDGDGMTYSFDPAAAGVGVHTITYSFTDGNSCFNSASDDVEVFALPVVAFTALADLCVDAGVQTAQGGGTPTGGIYSGLGVTDDGDGMTYSFDPAAAGVGVHTITYDFTDGNGCSGAASDDVEVFALPTVIFTALADLCIDAGVQTAQGGGTPTGGIYSGPGVTDNGDGMTYSFDPAAAGVGVHTITYTYNDLNGCTGSASDDVEVFALPVVAFMAPLDLCIDAGVQTAQGGGTPTGGIYSGPGVTDDGDGMTYSFDPTAAGVGVHTITYSFTDGNSCFNSASDDVEVFALPVVAFTALADLCVDAGVQTAQGGGTPTGGIYSGPGVTDDGDGMTYSFDPAAAGVGVHTITYDFTDGNGCSGAASDDVEVFALPTVTFTAPPSPVCPTLILTNQGGGTPVGGVYSGPGVTDDGDGMTYTFDSNVSGIGTHTITYTFIDGNGCTASASDMVTVEDNDPPVITCPADITVDNDPSECGAIVTFAATAIDNCPSTVTITYSQDPGTQFPVGTTIVTATATDGAGNVDTCMFNITVIDAEDPTITCPADSTVSTDPGVCGAVVTYTAPVATDNCDGLNITETFDFTGAAQNFTVPPGVTSITIDAFGAAGQFTTVDDFGNSSGGLGGHAAGTLTVTPGDVLTIFVAGTGIDGAGGFNGGGTGGFASAGRGGTNGFGGSGGGASDVRVGGASLADRVLVAGGGGGGGRNYVNGSCVPCGMGGAGGAGGGLVAVDGEDPTDAIYSIYFNPGSGGEGADQVMGGPGGAGTEGVNGNPGVIGIGGNGIPATQGAGSGAGGGGFFGGGAGAAPNSGSGAAGAGGAGGSSYIDGVTGGTTTAGVRSGNGQIIITYGSLMVAQTAGLPSGSTFPVGITTNTFVVTDGAGNTATCSFDVTVNDTEDPVITCPADIAVNNDPGVCGAIVTFNATATDNCGAVVTYSQDPGTSFPVGTTLVTATATDPSGNAVSCTFNVTVTDIEPPVAVCMDITVQLNAAGTASIVAGDIDGGSTDNCIIASLAISPSTFTCADVGTNTVTLTVTDVNGNSSSCTATVTVEDNVPPVALCQNITIQLDANGDASIVPADIDGGSTDACGIDTVTIDIDAFDCSNVGSNNVTLTVTDVNGNTATCIAVVTVEDTIDPLMNCPADITLGTDMPLCGATVSFADPLPIDNCGIASVIQTAGLPSGSLFPVGVSTVEYTATDVNGNTTICSFTVTVTDDDAPVAVCQDITIQLDAAGTATIVAADVDGGSIDNCAIASIAIDIATFTCADIGPNNVTLTVTDTAGLSTTCIAIVTVENGIMPTAVCQDATVQLDALGMVTIIDASIFDGGSTDACGSTNLTFSVSPATFTCAEVGENTVTLTVTDDGGNTSTCTAIVTVEDVIAPTVSCMDLTVSLDEDGLATIDPADLVVLSDDICGIAVISAAITEFDCDDVGTPVTVLITVEDPSGNTATCTAIVTVLDELAPELDCPAEVIVQTTTGTQYEVENFVTSGLVIATDNCTDPVNVIIQSPGIGSLLDPGTYPATLTVTDDSGNGAVCEFDLIVEEVLGTTSFDIASITLYPNPATDFVLLSNPQNIPLNDVSIYDVTGRLIKIVDASQVISELTIDISELASASYMLLINTDAGQMTKQFVKE